MSRQQTTAVNRVEIFKPVRFQTVGVFAAVMLMLLPLSSVQAAQQLTDDELDYRYLTVDAQRALVVPLAAQSAKLIPLMERMSLAGMSLDALQTMTSYQSHQLSSGTTGSQANSQKVFDSLVVSNLGSERYSLRWAGNLQDIVQINDLSSFFFNFNSITDVELVGVDTNIGIEVNINRTSRH